MATTTIDTSELEYLKSCRNKLRDINDILISARGGSASGGKDKSENEEEPLAEEKLREIKKILKE